MGASTIPASRATKLIRDAERRGDVLVVEVIRFLRIVLLDASGPSGLLPLVGRLILIVNLDNLLLYNRTSEKYGYWIIRKRRIRSILLVIRIIQLCIAL